MAKLPNVLRWSAEDLRAFVLDITGFYRSLLWYLDHHIINWNYATVKQRLQLVRAILRRDRKVMMAILKSLACEERTTKELREAARAQRIQNYSRLSREELLLELHGRGK